MRTFLIRTRDKRLRKFLEDNFFADIAVTFCTIPDEEGTLIGDFVRKNNLKAGEDYFIAEERC